jgi:hypothetical protein
MCNGSTNFQGRISSGVEVELGRWPADVQAAFGINVAEMVPRKIIKDSDGLMTSVRTSHQQKNVQASFQICGFWTRKRVK